MNRRIIHCSKPAIVASMMAVLLAGCGGYFDGGDPAVFDENDFALKSWIVPNYLPDTVIETAL